MAPTPEELARRLREAREAAGLRQEDVARHLELSRPSIAQIELSNRSVSGLELAQLARLYGRDVRDFLAEEFDPGQTVLALFRAAPEIAGQEEAIEAFRDCLELARELASLETLLGVDRSQIGAPAYTVEPPRTRWQAIDQGAQVADEERRRLGLGGRPLGDAPEFLEEQGIRTAMRKLPDEISGLTLMERGLSPSIVVNERHHQLRRRFSWVHEYGHVLLDRSQRGTISLTSRRDDLQEMRANSFAAGFLMPEEGVRTHLADLGRGPVSRERFEIFDESAAVAAEVRPEPGSQAVGLYELVLLAHHFQVSRTAALYRLFNLRILSQGERDRLMTLENAGQGKRIEDLLHLPQPDHTSAREVFRLRFLGLALEAYRREKITRSKLFELGRLMEYSPDTLEALLVNAGLDDPDDEPLLPESLG
ncbi:MAG TPA: XRE family transcriptional regulator [Thermoanaerobaculia bacterium]|jgi:Zn-dependent peptidase ImmA (M78 family)/transcriptional regulator with XRE-family HTH domain|nr:XRE family transcriptional regulator [Thermoanaerobaculia bacterium]